MFFFLLHCAFLAPVTYTPENMVLKNDILILIFFIYVLHRQKCNNMLETPRIIHISMRRGEVRKNGKKGWIDYTLFIDMHLFIP